MAQVKNEGTEILRVLCGSRAYNLHREDSDWDFHAVYVVPTRRLLAIGPKLKETAWIEGQDEDNTAWEVGHFLRLAIHCNPTILETMVAPAVSNTLYGEWVRSCFPYVLSTRYVAAAFAGYSHNQRKKLFEPPAGSDERRMWKYAVAYLRVLYHGIQLLEEGTYDPAMSGTARDYLLEVGRGEHSRGEVIDLAGYLLEKLEAARLDSKLPEEPNVGAINEVLLRIRKEFWDEGQ